ncbi:glycosyl transferase [Advenella kashmirensis W13003]|uniref:Glycosyl transferase n=2 Tax=Advenella kashmirensis TaxID=310575 RepID=V8QQ86_9BURK|nr:glycosyl transferase [Advenella kashmirensis W13003]
MIRADWLYSLAARPALFPVLLLAVAVWFIGGNQLWPLLHPDEGRYVGVALEMLHAKDWSTPLLNGMPYFHKPPLFYWLTAASMAVFGENEFAARLVPALAGLLMVAGLFAFLRRFVHPGRALIAALILSVTPLMFGAAHYANLDLLVAAMISTTILCGATAVLLDQQGEGGGQWVLAMYLFAGLGFLAKGLIGFVLPGGVLLFWLLAERRYVSIRLLLRPSGVALFLLVTLPWLYLMQARFPDFLYYYLVYQQFERFAQSGFNNVMPVWFYVAVLLATMAPWYGKGMLAVFTRRYWTRQRDASVRRLMWTWLILILAFFSIPQSKLVGYILPVLPPLAFLFAECFKRVLITPRRPMQTNMAAVQKDDKPQRFNYRKVVGLQRSFLIRMLVCFALGLAALVYLSNTSLRSSSRIAHAIAQGSQPTSEPARYYSLDYYPFDFRFYMGNNPDLFVVSDWDESALATKDNWQKELWDAARFKADKGGRSHLLQLDAFRQSVCVPQAFSRWLLADARQIDEFAWLKDLTPYFADGRQQVYLLPAGAVMPFCANAASTRSMQP